MCLVTACGVACASRRGSTRIVVEDVQIQGNRAFGDDDIVSVLATRPPRGFLFWRSRTTYDPLALQVDLRRVEAFYRQRGYFDAKVIDIDVVERGRKVAVAIEVREGGPTIVAQVTLRGLPYRRALPFAPGGVLDHALYRSTKQLLVTELRERGYAFAKVTGTVEVDRDRRRAVVRLVADPGPLVRFGKTRIEGLERVPESAVRARLAWHEGQVYDPERIDKTTARLLALGLFSTVDVQLEEHGRPAKADVILRVTEGVRHDVRLGGGIGVDRSRVEVRARAGYRVRGFVHPLVSLQLSATPTYTVLRGEDDDLPVGGEALFSLEREDVFVPRLRASVGLGYDIRRWDAFRSLGPGAGVTLDLPLLDDRLRLHAGWRITYLHFDVENGVPLVLDDQLLGYFDQGVTFDLRNDPVDPRRGVYAELRLEEGGVFAGGEEDYRKVTPEGRGYLPIGSRVVVAARARLGHLFGADSPITQRYYGGGASDHRGFAWHRLSPQALTEDGDGASIGGDTMLLASIEGRFRVARLMKRWLSTAAFIDAGDVTTGALPALDNLNYAVGLGLRYATPVGSLRVDVGMRVNRVDAAGIDGLDNPDPGERFAFHLSLGESF